MKRVIVILGLTIILITFILGFLVGAFYKYKGEINQQVKLTSYACHDGCSIATKNLTGDGFLNNYTWECWDKCDSYIEELLK